MARCLGIAPFSSLYSSFTRLRTGLNGNPGPFHESNSCLATHFFAALRSANILSERFARCRPNPYSRLMVLPAVRFRFEREMREPVRCSLPSFIATPDSADVRVLREPNIGNIIPDLLIGMGPGANTKGEIRPYRSSRIDAHVMTLLESHRSMSAVSISETIFMSQATVDQTLARLSRAGVVRRSRTGAWRLSAQHRCLPLEIVAVELKLSRWREAVCQASEYLKFADWSYVVLDGNRVRETAKIRSAFVSLGVGLFFQYGFSTVTVVEPRRNRPRPSVSRVLAVAKLFGKSTADSRRLAWHLPNDVSAFSTPETP